MRGSIAVAAVCLVLGTTAPGAAQETAPPPEEDAAASVELSLSLAPTALLSLVSGQFGAHSGGLGALGGFFTPTLDIGFALDRSIYLVLGASAAFSEGPQTMVGVVVPISVLWYLEPPRVGHVMPMLRVGASVSYQHFGEPSGPPLEDLSVFALARGGLTWLAARSLALRAEIGVRAGVGDSWGPELHGVGGSLGLDALVGLVLRV